MSLFKEGAEVVLRPRQGEWQDEHPCYTDEMVDECESGVVFKIEQVYTTGDSFAISSWGGYLWEVLPEWIEHYITSMENE